MPSEVSIIYTPFVDEETQEQRDVICPGQNLDGSRPTLVPELPKCSVGESRKTKLDPFAFPASYILA